MKWIIDDTLAFDRLWIREEPGADGVIGNPVCVVLAPVPAFEEPTEADRQRMVATAREIVEAHNRREPPPRLVTGQLSWPC